MKHRICFLIIWGSLLLISNGYTLILHPPNPGDQSGDQLIETYSNAFGEDIKNYFIDLKYLNDFIGALEHTPPSNFLHPPNAIDVNFARKDVLIHKICDQKSQKSLFALLDILDNEDSLYWKYREIHLLYKSLQGYLNNENNNTDEIFDIMTHCFSSYCRLTAMPDDLWYTPAKYIIIDICKNKAKLFLTAI
jgi:hypothetical protein